MKTLLFIFVMTLSSLSYAKINYARGEWGSGGGNAVVCFKKVTEAQGDRTIVRNFPQEVRENGNVISDEQIKYIESIEMFDLYEAKKRRGLNPNPPKIIQIKDTENAFEYVLRVAERFNKTVPYMEEIIKLTRQVLPENNFILEESAVRYQNDLGSVVIPNDHCVISTMAVQVNFNQFYKVHIDGRLFNHPKHSRLSQAVLILHETIYANARARGQKDSGTTRELVKQYITSGKYVTEGSVARALYQLDFDRADRENWPSQTVGIYNESNIMSSIYNESYEVLSDIGTFATEFYVKNPTFAALEEEIQKIINDHSISCDQRRYYSASIDELYVLAECALENLLPNLPEVKRLNKIKFDIKGDYIYQIYYIDQKIKVLKGQIVKKLLLTTDITKNDVTRLEKNFDILIEGYFGIMMSPGDLFKFYESIENHEKLMADIYIHYLGNICYGSVTVPLPVPGQPIPIPDLGNTDDDKCVDPLLLNNIIPEI
jgi:hypothetical protein